MATSFELGGVLRVALGQRQSSTAITTSSRLVLIMGPSGVGKTTTIRRLCAAAPRLVPVRPYVTRPLRKGERDKVSVTEEEIRNLREAGQLLFVQRLYGSTYATPRQPIESALANAQWPVLVWPVAKLSMMERAFPGRLWRVYLAPPSGRALARRLADGRDPNRKRLHAGLAELAVLTPEAMSNRIDHFLIVEDGAEEHVCRSILDGLGQGAKMNSGDTPWDGRNST